MIRSWLPWRTVETRHFAFHYPTELEAWTRAVAARADAIDSAVARVVGFAPSRKTQVIVDDPSGNPVELFQPTIPEAALGKSG